MASTPEWKVYRDGEYVAACKYAEDAAAFVSIAGSVVKHGHAHVVWTEGAEEFLAANSYDGAARIMEARRVERWLAAKKTYGGRRPIEAA